MVICVVAEGLIYYSFYTLIQEIVSEKSIQYKCHCEKQSDEAISCIAED